MLTLKTKQQSIFLLRNKQGLFPTENDVTLAGNRTKSDFSVANSEGLTLIEVMIAMVVLGVGLLALASMQISAITANSHASHISMASSLIGEKLDGYEAMDYVNVINESGVIENLAWATTVVADNPYNGLKTVTVTVVWMAGVGPHSISFGTVISQ